MAVVEVADIQLEQVVAVERAVQGQIEARLPVSRMVLPLAAAGPGGGLH